MTGGAITTYPPCSSTSIALFAIVQAHDLDCSCTDTYPPAQVDGIVAETRAGYARARGLVRAASGVRVLLALLHARAAMSAAVGAALRTLALRCLLGLAHDPALRHILSKLQVGSGLHQPCSPQFTCL